MPKPAAKSRSHLKCARKLSVSISVKKWIRITQKTTRNTQPAPDSIIFLRNLIFAQFNHQLVLIRFRENTAKKRVQMNELLREIYDRAI